MALDVSQTTQTHDMGIGYAVSGIGYAVSGIGYAVSGIGYAVSPEDIGYAPRGCVPRPEGIGYGLFILVSLSLFDSYASIIFFMIVLYKGDFGTVFRHPDNESRVVKRIATKDCHKTMEEGRILMDLNHRNIVKVFACEASASDEVDIVMEDAGKELFDLVPTERACEFLGQLASGLTHLHEKCIVHRDIKLENIMVGSDNTLRIVDFGLSERTRMISGCIGTLSYIAPEAFGTTASFCGYKADVWSMGVVFFAMVRNAFPFKAAVRSRSENFGPFKDAVSGGTLPSKLFGVVTHAHLIDCMLHPDPDLRKSAQDVRAALKKRKCGE